MIAPMQYEVENERIRELLLALGRRIKAEMPAGYGFSLLIFGYSPNNELFYLSSAQREDMIRTMQEFIQKFREN